MVENEIFDNCLHWKGYSTAQFFFFRHKKRKSALKIVALDLNISVIVLIVQSGNKTQNHWVFFFENLEF